MPHEDHVRMALHGWLFMSACNSGKLSSVVEKISKLASFESFYNDTGLPLAHGVATRSVSRTNKKCITQHKSPVIVHSFSPSLCILIFATKSVHGSGVRKILHKISLQL